MNDPIPYARHSLDTADIEAMSRCLQGDWLTQGPEIAAFEATFAEYVGAPYAVAVANGTAALHLCALALEVQAGHRVIVPDMTFVATANCVRYCGGEVVLADVHPGTALLQPETLQQMLEASPPGTYQGVIPVDFAGCPVDMEAIRALADAHGLWIIEDACHAPGGAWRDRSGQWQRCGSGAFADLAIFSFHPAKHITCGEGGMITTRDPALYARLQRLRNHGIIRDPGAMRRHDGGWYYEIEETGFNYRLTSFQAALGLSQLRHAAQWLDRRRALAAVYDAAFAGTPVRPLARTEAAAHAWHLYIVRVVRRREVYDFLRQRGIFCQVHYVPLHQLPLFSDEGWRAEQFPHTSAYYEECLSLPLFPTLTDTEQQRVISALMEAMTLFPA